jgi:taurine dioxygenase
MDTKSRLNINQITPVIGAVIDGVDLTRPLDPVDLQQIRETLLTRGVVFFRDQDLTLDQFAAFMRNFGPLGRDPFTIPPQNDMPDVTTIHNMPNYGKSAPDPVWHIDSTHGAEPAAFLALRALELPPSGGGDTCWGSMYAAYDDLSEPFRNFIDGLTAEHSGYKSLPRLSEEHRKYLQQDLRNVHPVVRVNPDTGRKALFVNELFTEKVVGLTAFESDCLLRMLWQHSQRLEFTMRWQWRVNDLALWDNRAFQHYPVRDYEGLRVLQKAYVKGDRPYGPQAR